MSFSSILKCHLHLSWDAPGGWGRGTDEAKSIYYSTIIRVSREDFNKKEEKEGGVIV